MLAASFAATGVAAAPLPPVPTPQFRSYGQLEGLPSSNVQAVAQDSRGFLWVATPAGLTRFDGLEFSAPGVGEGGRQPLSLSGITTMNIDREDRIWIGGGDIGVARYDVATGTFVQWRDGLSDDDVRAIAQTRDGSVWVGTSLGLDRIRPDGTVEHVGGSGSALAAQQAVHGLHATDDGRLWVGGDHGVSTVDMQGRIQSVPFVGDVPRVRHVDGRANELVFSTDHGVYRAGTDGRLRRDARLPAVLTYATLSDSHGNLWVATMDGLVLLDRHGRLHEIRGAWIAHRGIPGRSVRSMIEDDEHGLWFGLADGGLAYLGPGWDDFSRFTHVATDTDSLPARAVTAVAAKGGTALWVGGYRGWVRAFNPATGKTSAGFDIGPARVQSLFESGSDLLIGTVDGLSIASRGRVAPLVRGRIHRPVTAMVGDGDGGVYVAALGQGLFRVDPRRRLVEKIPFEGTSRDKADTRQMDLVDGELWQASLSGLSRRDASGTMRPVEGVSAGRINAFEPGDGGFWVVRPDLLEHYLWDGHRAERDVALGGTDGFPTSDILNIRRDTAGRLWLYGQTGVWRFDPGPKSFRRFGLADGLANGEFTNAMTVQLADGTMYGATVGGIVGFRPDRQRDHAQRPSIAVLGASVWRGGRRQPVSIDDGRLRIGWSDRELEIRARALSYVDPEGSRLHVAVEHDGEAFHGMTGRAGEYRFGALGSGVHRVSVSCTSRESGVSTSSASLRLQVDAPPWVRWWAWALYVVLAAIAAWAVACGTRRRVRQAMRLRLAEQERQLAEQANSAKTEFMATLGHEIRTPMTGVLGMAELMAQTALDDVQRGYVEAVRRSGSTLLRLINDALDISRIESRRLVLESEAVSVRAIADEVVALASGNARSKQLALSVVVDADVPDTVRGDAVRLRQILQNLVNNAVKFTERGSVSLHVAWGEMGLIARVTDTGPGMPEELISRLFSRFSQGGSPQRAEGSGLGLAICHELCALMGGSVEVESESGRGSVFTVRLPLQACLSEGATLPVDAGAGGGRRLLVVEDDPMIAEVMSGLLHRRGHEVSLVGDGLSAMAELSRGSFDVLLLDLDLPVVSGFQVARMVRRMEHLDRMPIVAVTARSAGDESSAIREAGMDALVRKPMTGADLDAALEAVVR